MALAIRTDHLELLALDSDGARRILEGAPREGLEWAGGYPLPATRELAEAVASADSPVGESPYAWFEIVVRASGRVIGHCGFETPPARDGGVEVAYALADEASGRGHEVEALEALVGFAFLRDEVSCVRASARADDVAGRRVLERAGMMRVAEDAERAYFEA